MAPIGLLSFFSMASILICKQIWALLMSASFLAAAAQRSPPQARFLVDINLEATREVETSKSGEHATDTDVQLVAFVSDLQTKGVTFKNMLAKVQSTHPEWAVGSKEIRAVLKQLNTQDAASGPPFDVVNIPQMGMGVVATRDIAAGQRLIAECPLLSIAPSVDDESDMLNVQRAAQCMTMANRTALFSLSQHTAKFGDEKNLKGIWMTNALPLNHGHAGVFKTVSRFNHACSPNAYACWNGLLERETVHAIVDISQGSQISIDYFREGSRAVRQEHLKREFGFECKCTLCGLAGAALLKSDTRQQRISDLDVEILAASQAARPKRAVLRMIEERIKLISEEGLAATRAKRSMVDAVQVCQAHVAALGLQPHPMDESSPPLPVVCNSSAHSLWLSSTCVERATSRVQPNGRARRRSSSCSCADKTALRLRCMNKSSEESAMELAVLSSPRALWRLACKRPG
mmetsp:Transcript_40481/g.81146  ORF Transcript_40481/g.81146 Transcript_40481/m.81146 type:complete len:461 (-) Transcript_40481:342-1724(-)